MSVYDEELINICITCVLNFYTRTHLLVHVGTPEFDIVLHKLLPRSINHKPNGDALYLDIKFAH